MLKFAQKNVDKHKTKVYYNLQIDKIFNKIKLKSKDTRFSIQENHTIKIIIEKNDNYYSKKLIQIVLIILQKGLNVFIL